MSLSVETPLINLGMKYAGADWIKGCKVQMSPFGELVADILGQAFQGIYNVPSIRRNPKRVDWKSDRFIEIRLDRSISTYDDSYLTALVLLCHAACVRMEVTAHANRVALCFSRRTGREGRMYEKHPGIDQAIAMLASTVSPVIPCAERYRKAVADKRSEA